MGALCSLADSRLTSHSTGCRRRGAQAKREPKKELRPPWLCPVPTTPLGHWLLKLWPGRVMVVHMYQGLLWSPNLYPHPVPISQMRNLRCTRKETCPRAHSSQLRLLVKEPRPGWPPQGLPLEAPAAFSCLLEPPVGPQLNTPLQSRPAQHLLLLQCFDGIVVYPSP